MQLLFGVNLTIELFAAPPDVYLVDAYAAFDDEPGEQNDKPLMLFVDEVHPSEKGQVLLYQAAVDVYCSQMAACN